MEQIENSNLLPKKKVEEGFDLVIKLHKEGLNTEEIFDRYLGWMNESGINLNNKKNLDQQSEEEEFLEGYWRLNDKGKKAIKILLGTEK